MEPNFTTQERAALVALCQQAKSHFQTDYNELLVIRMNENADNVSINSASKSPISFDRRNFRKLLVETNASDNIDNDYLLREFDDDILELRWAQLHQILKLWSRADKIDALLSGS